MINIIQHLNKHFSNNIKNMITILKNINFNFLIKKEFQEDDSKSYLRNIIFQNDNYELILIKWKPNSESLIHDHSKNGCILKVIEGTLKETLYDKNIKEIKQTIYNKEEVNYINNQIGYHKITNLNNTDTYSLHLYSPPNHKIKYYKNNIL
jgi:cysteine dioxygenase